MASGAVNGGPVGLVGGNALAWPAAMSYDPIVHAIGPFELTEYLGLAIILGSLAVTWRSVRPPGT